MISTRRFAVLLVPTALVFVGCDKPAEPPKPIAVDKAPEALQQAFKETPEATRQASQAGNNESAATRQMVADATAALQAQEFGKAIFLLEKLSSQPGLSRDQRDFVTRSMMAAHKALSEAAAAGNADAARALEIRRATK